MKPAAQIKADLANFTGTEAYHRFSYLFPSVVITDGVKYLADECGAYWLLDVIGSHTPCVDDGFAIAILTKNEEGSGAKFALQDDVPPSKTWATQDIEFTDFPLAEIKLYVIRNEHHWVVLLPSEY